MAKKVMQVSLLIWGAVIFILALEVILFAVGGFYEYFTTALALIVVVVVLLHIETRHMRAMTRMAKLQETAARLERRPVANQETQSVAVSKYRPSGWRIGLAICLLVGAHVLAHYGRFALFAVGIAGFVMLIINQLAETKHRRMMAEMAALEEALTRMEQSRNGDVGGADK